MSNLSGISVPKQRSNEQQSTEVLGYVHKGGLNPPFFIEYTAPHSNSILISKEIACLPFHTLVHTKVNRGKQELFSASTQRFELPTPENNPHSSPALHGKTRKKRHLLRHNKRPRTQ
jgi:hypothetical protein